MSTIRVRLLSLAGAITLGLLFTLGTGGLMDRSAAGGTHAALYAPDRVERAGLPRAVAATGDASRAAGSQVSRGPIDCPATL